MNSLRGSAACAIAPLLIVTSMACNSPTQLQSDPVVLDKNVVADVFGNHDGATDPGELQFVDEYFALHSEAWCISAMGHDIWNTEVLSADQVKALFVSMATRPYPSELVLRQSYDGTNIRTPYVSVVVLQRSVQIVITRLYRSPGAGIAAADWQELTVK